MEYATKRLAGEDIAFFNYRGVQGAPIDAGACANATFACLYGLPKDNPANAPSYYSAAVMQHNQTAIQSTEFMLRQPFLDNGTKATLQHTLTQLRDVANTQVQRPQEQMTKLLENTKSLLAHRQVDGEPQVAEAIGVIDSVLQNIKGYTRPDASEASAKFFDLYSPDVKGACELALGTARNPYPLFDTFMESESVDPADMDQAWQRAMDTARPQARALAQTLKDVLTPYAGTSGPAGNNASGDQAAAKPSLQRSDSWTLV